MESKADVAELFVALVKLMYLHRKVARPFVLHQVDKVLPVDAPFCMPISCHVTGIAPLNGLVECFPLGP